MSVIKGKEARIKEVISGEEKKLLGEFAVQPGLFTMPGGAHYRRRLDRVLHEHWVRVKDNVKQRATYLFLLIMHCPEFLDRQPGFEWITQEYKRMWLQCIRDISYQTQVWLASSIAFNERRKGLPTVPHIDYARVHRVRGMIAAGMNKTWAVAEAAAIEPSRKKGYEMTDTRTIDRSWKKVIEEGHWTDRKKPIILPTEVARSLLEQQLADTQAAFKTEGITKLQRKRLEAHADKIKDRLKELI